MTGEQRQRGSQVTIGADLRREQRLGNGSSDDRASRHTAMDGYHQHITVVDGVVERVVDGRWVRDYSLEEAMVD
ncbi:hypothetical protein Dimus_006031, partial [Dionaea muscipula]